MRLERNQQQQEVAKLLDVSQVYLSSWELNRQEPHPRYLESIVNYLGYFPKINLSFEKIGMAIKFYRMKYNLSLQDFCQMCNIEIDIVLKYEKAHYCKPLKTEVRAIKRQFKLKPTFSSEVC